MFLELIHSPMSNTVSWHQIHVKCIVLSIQGWMFRQDGVLGTAVGLGIRRSDKVQCNYASDRKVIIYTGAEENQQQCPL